MSNTKIALIVAMAKNRAIGKNGQLLCHLANDLKHFKNSTTGHTVVMGRKTFESLPKGALPNRRNIILSEHLEQVPENTEVVASINELFEKTTNENKIFIIGGGTVYEQFIEIADYLYITYLDKEFEGDTFFPPFNLDDWELMDLEVIDDDPTVDFSYRFERYERDRLDT
ncbi:MAG: dihydrofolate reductase [Lentimicrobiaceae bacterium]|jgi:dihydrofolate reductase|nr:dihydrofolate reductase [Lentimicrobiaceae bacterium]